jgi:TolB-like protein
MVWKLMQPGEFEGQAARRQLERVLASAAFNRNERLSQFLRFIVERHLEGEDSQLKESVIAMEVFGRRADYDPKLDSIVRTEAGRLRARLADYYAGEGKHDEVIIEVPKGGYAPLLRHRSVQREEPKPRSERFRFLAVAAVLLLVAALIGGWWWFHRSSQPITVAVLPLENLSKDPANEYFADGLTDEIIRNLAMIEGLAVRSRTSSFAFKGKPRTAREVGAQLEADYILEGSALRAGHQLRVNTQLIRVRDDFTLWSGRFDREVGDVFAIQDEISRGIVNNLRLNLGHGRRRYETSVEAYDLYLRARALPYQKGAAGQVQSIELFEQVTAKDPTFAPAYAGLAAAYAVRSVLFALPHSDDELSKMRATAEKAIELDPLLAEARDALGMVYAHDGRWDLAEKSFNRAIELDPNRALTYNHFAIWFLMVLGRINEAVSQLRFAERTDPLAPVIHENLAFVLTSAGRYDEAADQCRMLPQDDPPVIRCLARARLGQGKIDEAIQLLARVRGASPNEGFLGYAYARSGRREEAESLEAANAGSPQILVLIYAGLGDKDRTFEALERMAPEGPGRIGQYLTYPELSLLRGDPRLKTLRKKVGLPE